MTSHPRTPIIEVFADVRCPFAHVGLRRFVEWRAEHGLDLRLWVRAWPLELVNESPMDPARTADHVTALRQQVVGDSFRGFEPSRFPASSLPALSLAAAAYDRDLATGEAASFALRNALFEEGRDVGAMVELAAIATRLGLTGTAASASLFTDWHEGQRRNVVGSPHFFVAGEGFFCPGLDIEHRSGATHITRGRAFEQFLARCLAVAAAA